MFESCNIYYIRSSTSCHSSYCYYWNLAWCHGCQLQNPSCAPQLLQTEINLINKLLRWMSNFSSSIMVMLRFLSGFVFELFHFVIWVVVRDQFVFLWNCKILVFPCFRRNDLCYSSTPCPPDKPGWVRNKGYYSTISSFWTSPSLNPRTNHYCSQKWISYSFFRYTLMTLYQKQFVPVV